jgi:hypothetical protein
VAIKPHYKRVPAIHQKQLAMSEPQQDIDMLLTEAGDYLESKASLFKLRTVETTTDLVSTLVSGLGLFCILGLVIVTFSIGAALLIGDWLGKNFYGFFIIGGVYVIAGLICYVFRDRWLKEPVSNILIRKMLK